MARACVACDGIYMTPVVAWGVGMCFEVVGEVDYKAHIVVVVGAAVNYHLRHANNLSRKCGGPSLYYNPAYKGKYYLYPYDPIVDNPQPDGWASFCLIILFLLCRLG